MRLLCRINTLATRVRISKTLILQSNKYIDSEHKYQREYSECKKYFVSRIIYFISELNALKLCLIYLYMCVTYKYSFFRSSLHWTTKLS